VNIEQEILELKEAIATITERLITISSHENVIINRAKECEEHKQRCEFMASECVRMKDSFIEDMKRMRENIDSKVDVAILSATVDDIRKKIIDRLSR